MIEGRLCASMPPSTSLDGNGSDGSGLDGIALVTTVFSSRATRRLLIFRVPNSLRVDEPVVDKLEVTGADANEDVTGAAAATGAPKSGTGEASPGSVSAESIPFPPSMTSIS